MADGMNAKQRYLAKKEAKEEAYYKGLEAPQTKMVDTGNGFTEVQTNTDKNGMVNSPVNNPENNKRTTLQNYKPVEGKPVGQPQEQAQTDAQAEAQTDAEVVGNTEVPQGQVEQPAQQQAETQPDVKVTVPEVDEEMMGESGINPKNSEEQNQKGTENAISEITGGRNKDGTYKPLNKVQYADGIQKFGIFATIASIGLAVLTRGAFPPVDFSAITGLNDSYAKYLEGIDNYNKYVRQAQGENAYEKERAKGSIDDAKKTAALNAAGDDHAKETDAKWAEYLKKIDAVIAQDKAKLDNELNVALQGVLTEGQLDVIKANADVQKAVLELMYKQDISKVPDTAKKILEANLSNNDLERVAKFVKSQDGQTRYENILKAINTGANAVNAGANAIGNVANAAGTAAGTAVGTAVKTGSDTGSDAGTKEFFKRMIKF